MVDRPTSLRSRLDRPWVWAALVAFVAGAAFAVSLQNGFVLDDVRIVELNPRLTSLSSIPGHFTETYWPIVGEETGLYRPVMITSLTLNRAIAGPGPLGYHAGNVLLHMIASAMAWFTLRRCGVHYGTALVGGLLFAVHPLHAEAVANVVGRAEILVAIGVMAAWSAHRRGLRIVSWLAYLLALLSKESAILAPLLFLVDDMSGGQVTKERRSSTIVQYTGYAVAVGVMLVLRYNALGDLFPPSQWFFLDNPIAAEGTGARLLTASWIQLLYAALFVVPWRLTSDYGFDAIPVVRSLADPRAWLGLLWMATLAIGVIQGLRRHRVFLLATVCWSIFLLPTSNLLFPLGTIMGERLTYLASLGGCLLLGHLTAGLVAHGTTGDRRRRVVVITACVILLTACFVRAWDRTTDWRSNYDLALADARSTPRAAKAQFGLGVALLDRGETEGAREHLQGAVDVWPDYAQARFNLGALLLDQGDVEGGRLHLERSRDLAGGTFLPYERLAPLYERLGDADAALEAYAVGLRIRPNDLSFRFNYGRLLLTLGREDEANQQLRRLMQIDPSGQIGQIAAGLVAQQESRDDDAARIYRALLDRPNLAPQIRKNIEGLLASTSR